MHSAPTLILFWSSLLIGLPLGALLCRLYKPFLYLFFALMLLMLFFPEWSIHFFSREQYRAATRGIEVHPSDLCCWALLLGMLLRREEFRWRLLPPLFLLQLLFLAAACLSWLSIPRALLPNSDLSPIAEPVPNFEISLYPLFEIFKLARGALFFFTLYHLFQKERARRLFFQLFCLAALYFSLYALLARYLWSEHRATPPYFHVNDFSTILGILGLYLLPFSFKERSYVKSLSILALSGGCFVGIILTISRSSLAGFSVAALLSLLFCLARFPTRKNFLFLLLAFFASIGLAAKAADTLIDRFQLEEALENIEGRGRFNRSAYLMGREHPFGVGLGNFVAWSVYRYADKTGADPYNIAHNAWFLTFAELGLPGLILFILIGLRFYQMGISSAARFFASNKTLSYAEAAGALGAVTYMQFQNLFHFSFRSFSVFFLVQALFALTAHLYTESKGKESLG